MSGSTWWRVVLAVGLAATASHAESVPSPDRQTQFRSRIDVVGLNVSVLNGSKAVVDLTASDFLVSDNGVRQIVMGVTRETVPIDLTVAIDTSENMARAMSPAIEKAVNRLNGHLRPTDRVSVVTFDSQVHERTSLVRAPIGPVDARPTGGRSALHDALALVLTPKPVVDRRQMAIVFTDGFNSADGLSEADVLDLAGRSNVAVFIVTRVWKPGSSVLMSGPVSSHPERQPLAFFERLAGVTGGLTRFVSPGSKWVAPNGSSSGVSVNQNILDDAAIQTLDEFRSGYVLRYSPGAPDAGWHDVAVSVTRSGNKYSVRTRSGYLVK